jgi:ankyrin repeat protein
LERTFRAAADGNIQAFAEAFVQTDMDVNARDTEGWTALHHAIMRGKTLMVAYLLGITGIDANALTPQGEPPVLLAVGCRWLGCLGALLAHEETDVNLVSKKGDALIHALLGIHRKAYWAAFVNSQKKADLLKKGANGKLPKQMAAEAGWMEVAAQLPPLEK